MLRAAQLSLAVAFLTLPVQAQQSEGASVSGTVVNWATGAPVRRAGVTLTVAGADKRYASCPTDGNGRFLFTSLPPGDYRLEAYRSGYIAGAFGARQLNQPGKVIHLGEGLAAGGLVIRLMPSAAISGVVLDQEGDPIPNAQIQLLVVDYERGRPHYSYRNAANANDRGEYRIWDLWPGRYYAMASERWASARLAGAVVRSGTQPAEPEMGYGVQFYPGASSILRAAPISIGPGKDMHGIDFHLPAIQRVKVSGKVVGPIGDVPSPSVQIGLVPQDVPESNNFSMPATASPPNFTFEAQNLLPGTYLMVAMLASEGKMLPYRGVQRIEVGNSNLEDVTVALQQGISLSGFVQVEGEGSEKYDHFKVTLVPGDYLPLNGPAPATETDRSFRFHFADVLPGIWDIGVDPIPEGGYLKAMYLGDQDVLTEDMVIGPNSSGPLKIVLSTRAPKLRGKVLSEKPDGERQATIVLAPTGKYSHVMSFYRFGAADQHGQFELRGLTPGAYLLFAFEEQEPALMQNPEVYRRLEGLGEPVQLEEGVETEAAVNLVPPDTLRSAP